uniref:Rab interacting lysosomal protein n=1 Tax=Monodelphis domestica TaxID=13616 RepID=F7AVB4_MONDO
REPEFGVWGILIQSSGQGLGMPELVYQLAGALGTELQRLASRFGPGAAAGLVPHVVRALELLEGAAAGAPRGPEEEAGESLGDEQRDEWPPGAGTGGRGRAAPPSDERLLLRQLKQVTDRQRDQLRAQSRDLQLRGQEVEALQEQLQRLLRVNGELRCKLAAVQVQLRAAQQRAAEGEGAPGPPSPLTQEASHSSDTESQSQEKPEGFSREEVSRILQERNELKANVFLLQEELNYYQRELLADHRVPGLLLDAMKLTVKKQRRKIKAKMLGTPDAPGSSWLSLVLGCGFLPSSRLSPSFSFWYWGNPEPSPELPQSEAVTHPPEELPPPPPASSGGTP